MVSSIAIGLIVFVCVFGGALLGLFLRTVLPEQHLSEESKDVVKLVTGLIATLAALVLGLLVASAKSSFDTVNEGFRQSAARVIVLDRTLAQYGPEAKDVREAASEELRCRVEQLFPKDRSKPSTLGASQGTAAIEGFQQRLRDTLATERHPALAPVARPGAHRRCGPGALAGDRTGGEHDSDAFHGGARVLACRHVCQLRPVRTPQRNRNRRAVPWLAVTLGRDLPDRGAEQPDSRASSPISRAPMDRALGFLGQ